MMNRIPAYLLAMVLVLLSSGLVASAATQPDSLKMAALDEKLTEYLTIAGNEILYWMYHMVGGVPVDMTEVPTKYENIQVYAVIAGYTQAGAEGEQTHIENSVHRHFRYSDMLDYIHNNVLAYVRVGAVRTE